MDESLNKNLAGSNNPSGSKTETKGLSQEEREYLSGLFVRTLQETKLAYDNNPRILEVKPYKNLVIFKAALEYLIDDPRFPKAEEAGIRMSLLKLNPFDKYEIQFYKMTIATTMLILRNVFTPELHSDICRYTDKIFNSAETQ